MPKTLDDLLAESAIKDVHIRYCRANDRRDEALMRSCFHPDAVIDVQGPLDLEAFIAESREALRPFEATWHNTGNQLVEVEGDIAWAEHYTTSSHHIAADGHGPERMFVVSGRYIDRMERREGEWRIARRIMVLDFSRTDPVGAGALEPGLRPGMRNRSDPSYAMRLTR